MYGTISRMKVKPGAMEALKKAAETGPQPQGMGISMVFQMDAASDEVYAVGIAESEQKYRAISDAPGMHEAYLERLQWLQSEPEWNDGQVIQFRHHPVPEDAELYGSIAEMHLKPGALQALMDRGNGDSGPEGAVALCVFQTDADPNQVFVVAVSESEAAYRAYSESQESHQRYLEMVKWLEGEPKWHDGRLLDYRVLAG